MSDTTTVTPPSRILTALELRAIGEGSAMAAAMPLLAKMRGGDGHTVLVLPGFAAGDESTGLLRGLLDKLGYDSRPWRLGRNMGPTPAVVEGLGALIERHSANGPVSIVGWSMGGVYAREIARMAPDSVRQVITLGSPIHLRAGDRSATSDLWESLEGLHEDRVEREPEASRPPVPVPTTAIYTRTDGIVRWQTCLTPEAPTHENIEVHGSHCGLGTNSSVAYVVADRLRQAPGEWHRFRAPFALRHLFPKSGRTIPGQNVTN